MRLQQGGAGGAYGVKIVLASWALGCLMMFGLSRFASYMDGYALHCSDSSPMGPAELQASVLRQKITMHEHEGDRLRRDIAVYETRVKELEKNLAASMANTEASLALAESSQTLAEGCDEDSEDESKGPDSSSDNSKANASIGSSNKENTSPVLARGAGAPSRPDGQRGFGYGETAPDGGVITGLVPGWVPGMVLEEADEVKRAAVRASAEENRRTTVRDQGKREVDAFGQFVGFNRKKKAQLPHNYFIDYNETLDSHDVRPDGTYIGYSTPKRKAWLTKHTKRILHDFQWVYENNRVHQRQRFMGVRIGQDPFDALVIQEMLWDVKPDLIIETGTNSGGGALYMATLMEFINPSCKIFTIDTLPIEEWVTRFKGGGRSGRQLLSSSGSGNAKAEDTSEDGEYDLTGLVDPRENPAWKKRVTQAVGKSTDRRILRQLKHDFVAHASKVLVVLDSDHSSGTVLSELINYAPFVSLGSYILVEDTWQRHPLFAAEKFLAKYGAEFVQDRSREHLLWSQHKGGYLKRVQLPARSKATGDVDFEYSVDVEVSGGRIKTYGPVDTSSVS